MAKKIEPASVVGIAIFLGMVATGVFAIGGIKPLLVVVGTIGGIPAGIWIVLRLYRYITSSNSIGRTRSSTAPGAASSNPRPTKLLPPGPDADGLKPNAARLKQRLAARAAATESTNKETVSVPPAATPRPPASKPSPAVAPPQLVSAHATAAKDEPLYEAPPSAVPKPSPANYRLPKAPDGFGVGRWIPPGSTIEIGGLTIPGGMVYFGTSLEGRFGGSDPSLIDPRKPIAKHGDFRAEPIGYWPTYGQISPEARRAYLQWLYGGRQHPDADIGFVFLFFYGLERRVIIDALANGNVVEDRPAIVAELRRLLRIYGERSNSFRRYASSLLEWLEAPDYGDKLYLQPVPPLERGFELPLYLKVALGQAAIDGAPVPAATALEWVRYSPDIFLRTPAIRCPDLFARVFATHYAFAFGSGLILPRNRTPLKFVYRPASAGIAAPNGVTVTIQSLPDVSLLTAPLKKLRGIVDTATGALEPYSRYLGRNPDAGGSLEAILLLPPSLWQGAAQRALQSLVDRAARGMIVLSLREILETFDSHSALTKAKLEGLVRALEGAGIGMEPDILAGAKCPKIDDTVVLFGLPEGDQGARTSAPYRAAQLTVQLASMVAAADGKVAAEEINHLREQVMSWTHLNAHHHRRLLALLRLRIAVPVTAAQLKKQLEPLDQAARETIAAFLATVAQSDGVVSPQEVKTLEKIYKTLGVDAKKVFGHLHAVAAAPAAAPAESAGPEPVEEPPVTGFKLDAARIAELQRDTERVGALLAGIFTEPETETEPSPPDTEPPEPTGPPALLGLDEAHSAFARALLSRPQWQLVELHDVSADLDLLLQGALTLVNEASLDHYDLPLTEGDDPVTVNTEVLEKLTA